MMNIGTNKKTDRKTKFRAEIWDQLQFLFSRYSDHQIHSVIYFNGLLDIEIIKKAVLVSTDIFPILGSRFVIKKGRPYWEKVYNSDENDMFSVEDSVEPEKAIYQFLVGKTNEFTGPQILVKVIRSLNKDALCIVINHMVCDGEGLKDYLYLLGQVYTNLKSDSGYKLNYKIGNRSSKQIYTQFSFLDKLKIFLLPNNLNSSESDTCFLLSKERVKNNPVISTYKIPRDKFFLIKAYSKEHSVTINDIILTAYYRALYKMLEIDKNKSISIPCMVDLRRYLPNKKADTICNLSSMIMCNINSGFEESFEETLKKVSNEMKSKKNSFAGLHGLSSINALFRFLPFSIVKKIILWKYVNAPFEIANSGIIDSAKLAFGEVPIEDAIATGSVKYPPYLQLDLSSYNNTITFSVNLFASEKDLHLVQTLFDIMENEFKNVY